MDPLSMTSYNNEEKKIEKKRNKNLRIISWINKTNQVAEEGGTISVHQVESGQRDGTWMKTDVLFSMYCCYLVIYI